MLKYYILLAGQQNLLGYFWSFDPWTHIWTRCGKVSKCIQSKHSESHQIAFCVFETSKVISKFSYGPNTCIKLHFCLSTLVWHLSLCLIVRWRSFVLVFVSWGKPIVCFLYSLFLAWLQGPDASILHYIASASYFSHIIDTHHVADDSNQNCIFCSAGH